MKSVLKRPLSILLAALMVMSLFVMAPVTSGAVVSPKLTIKVGENGKVVMNGGVIGNAVDPNWITEFSEDISVDPDVTMVVANGESITFSNDASLYTLGGSTFSVYPSADNTGIITATPDVGCVFAGWYNGDTLYSSAAALSYQSISEDTTLTAKFAPAYTVTWKNWNGDVLETDTGLAAGSTPSYDGEAPTRAADDSMHYTLAAWDDGATTYILGADDLPTVTGDVTYTAVFIGDYHTMSTENAVFEWASDYGAAAVSVTCSDCGCTKSADATVTSEITTYPTQDDEGEITYTASAVIDGVTYEDTQKVAIPAKTYVTTDGKAIDLNETFTRNSDDTADFQIGSVFKNLEILGVQTKKASSDTNRSVRFIAALSNEAVQDAEEYGFIAVAGNDLSNARQNIADVTYSTAKNKFNCKNTNNNVSGEYGEYAAEKDYNYITFSVNNIGAYGVAVKFYLKDSRGNIYYADYTNGSGITFNNCSVDWSALVG